MCAVSQAMVMFHGKEKFSRDLFDILSKLATDDNVAVRQSIAYGIHEVIVSVVCAGPCITRSNLCGLMFICALPIDNTPQNG